jgi:hypothetical protein
MSNPMQDLHAIGLNPFSVTLLAESMLKSEYVQHCGAKPLTFNFPIQRSDCAGWAGVRITIEAVPDARGIDSGEAGQTPQAAGPEGQEPGGEATRPTDTAEPSTQPAAPAQLALTNERIVKLWGPRSDGPSNAEIISFGRAILAASQSPAEPAAQVEPIDMVLHCPKCGKKHIDAPEEHWNRAYLYSWENPPHRSHLCYSCGHIWRPADVPTNGVYAVRTKGKADSPIATPQPAAQVAPLTLREGLSPLECFAHEVVIGAYRWRELPGKATIALRRQAALASAQGGPAPQSVDRDAAEAPRTPVTFRVGEKVVTGEGYAGTITAIDRSNDASNTRVYSVHISKGRGDLYGWWELVRAAPAAHGAPAPQAAQHSEQPAAQVAPVSRSWMIEMTASPTPLWFTGEFNSSEKRTMAQFTNASCGAVRYPTQAAAQTQLDSMLAIRPRVLLDSSCYSVTEHEWCGPIASAGVRVPTEQPDAEPEAGDSRGVS